MIELGGAAEVFYNAGLLRQRNRMQDAGEYYRHALQENPSFAEGLLNLGHVMRALDREDEAQSFRRRALREKPELAQLFRTQRGVSPLPMRASGSHGVA